jgi:hypothetical protein
MSHVCTLRNRSPGGVPVHAVTLTSRTPASMSRRAISRFCPSGCRPYRSRTLAGSIRASSAFGSFTPGILAAPRAPGKSAAA